MCQGLDECSSRVLRAQAGDAESLTWLIVYFSPLLLAQARYRLRGVERLECEAEDLVDETWAVTLPRLGDLRGEPARLGRAMLAFLITTLANKVQSLQDRRRRRPGTMNVRSRPGSSVLSVLDRCPSPLGPASVIVRNMEVQAALHAAIAALCSEDREIVVLRGLEQRSNEQVAELLGLSPAGATRRYQRALERLRHRLPGPHDGLTGE